MTSINAMRALLRGTGLYRLDGKTAVDAELCAYAAALDRLGAQIDELLREGIVATAADWGLSVWETLMGEPDKSQLGADARRAMIVYRLSVMPGDFNRAGIINALQSVGLEADIDETPGGTLIRVNEKNYTGLRRCRALIEQDCLKLLPAHLDAVFDVGVYTFDIFDGEDATWDERDMADETWAQIENRGSL